MIVGILALQGAFHEHAMMLERMGVEWREVRLPSDMHGIDGLIIPGGESTVMSKLALSTGLHEPLQEWIQGNKPTLGTCAGLILMADRLERNEGESSPMIYGGIPITVHRNHYGRQIASHVRTVKTADGQEVEGMFIRAPKITNMHGEGVEVVARCIGDEEVVGVRYGNLIGLSFHPELIQCDHFHRLFIHLC